MEKKFPVHPAHPERICWGCDQYCPADSMSCGNGSERTPHPVELFGDDWINWGSDYASSDHQADLVSSHGAHRQESIALMESPA
jgi:hypothetical protein